MALTSKRELPVFTSVNATITKETPNDDKRMINPFSKSQ